MSQVTVEGETHYCTREALVECDAYAVKHKCSREEAFAKLFMTKKGETKAAAKKKEG